MRLASDWGLSSDAELITAVRSGVADAFGTLYERHVDAARSVARQYSNSGADAEDAVSDAFSRVFSAIQGGGGPDVAFRAYLFTVIRRVALVRVESGRRAQPTDDLETFESAFGEGESTEEPTMAGFERGVVSQAYKSLPERWQAVLWYTEVEELTPAEIAPVLGLTANGVAALAYRAREGLRQAYLQQHLAAPASEACTIVNRKLGAYVRGGLAKRETALVESHLEECGTCRALVLELGDVNHGMRVVIAPLVLGAAALVALKGLGFGGAAGAVGAAAAAGAGGAGVGAGAGSGTAAGLGSGAGAGAAAGGGSLVGAGSGVLGATASGLVAAGAGAAVLVDAVHSAAPAAGSSGASSAGAGSSLSGAGAGGVAGAGTTGAAGGFAGLLASVPGVIGVVAAGVVVAAAVGVAGLLGAFSPNADPQRPPTVITAAEPDPTSPADPTDEGTGTEPAPSTEGTGTVDPTGPGNVPGTVAEPAVTTTTPDVTTVVTTTPVTTPTTPPTPPPTPPPTTPPTTPPTPVDPVQVATVGALSLVSGQPTLVSVTVTSAVSGTVNAEFAFAAGQVGTVTLAPSADALGSGTARSAVPTGGWTCASTTSSATLCANPTLEAGVPSVLEVLVSVLDDDLDAVDGPADVAFGITTWMVGSDAPRVSVPVTGKLFSPPARITAHAAAGVELTGEPSDQVLEGVIAFPISNEGGTTVRGLGATVTLPSGLPTGVTVTAPDDAAGWSCTQAGDVLDCLLAEIPRTRRGATPVPVPLVLGVSAPDLDLDAPSPLLDLSWAGDVRVVVDGAAPVVGPLSVSSAPEDLAVSLDVAHATPGAPRELTVRIDNDGGTTAEHVTARLAGLKGGMVWLLPTGGGWTDCGDDACLTLDKVGALARPEPTTIRLIVPSGTVDAGTYPIVLTVTDANGARATASTDVVVTAVAGPALEVSGPTAPFVMTAGEPTDVPFTITNTGDTTLTDLRADVVSTRPMRWDGSTHTLGDGWWCSPADGSTLDAVCHTKADLVPGAVTTLNVSMIAPPPTDGAGSGLELTVVIRVSAHDVDPVEVTVPVTVVKADDSLLDAAPVSGTYGLPTVV